MKPSELLVNELDCQDEDILAFVDEKFQIKSTRKTKEVRFHFVEGFDPKGLKLPTQAIFLLKAITDAKEPLTYVQWGGLATKIGMGTKQDPARIAAYYRPVLVKAGAVVSA